MDNPDSVTGGGGALPSDRATAAEPVVSALRDGIPSAAKDWKAEAVHLHLECIEWAGRHQEAMHIIADLQAALVLTAEYNPEATVCALVEGSSEYRRASDYLLRHQFTHLIDLPAQGTSASGQDGNRLEAQPAGPVGETDAPIPHPTSPQPIPAEGGVKP